MKFFFSFFMIGLLLVRPAFAGDVPLKAGILLEKPWGYYDASGQLKGVAVSYFEVLSGYLDRPVIVDAVPAQRLIHGMERGDYDLSVMLPERRSFDIATAIDPIIKLDKVIVGLKGMDISSRKDIEGLRLAYVRGSTTGTWIDNTDKVQKIETANFREALWLLKKGRVDAVTSTEQVLEATLEVLEMNYGDLGNIHFLSCRQAMLMLSKRSLQPINIPDIKDAAEKLRNSSEWQELLVDASKNTPSFLKKHDHL